MRCVKCDGTLRAVQIEEIQVDQCDVCSGIWFDARELDRVLSKKRIDAVRARVPVNPADDALRGRCPRCRGEGKLVQVKSPVGRIHIDTCPVCGGQWLDGGELSILRQEGVLGAVRRLFKWVLDLD
jgi:uncharacterized protein